VNFPSIRHLILFAFLYFYCLNCLAVTVRILGPRSQVDPVYDYFYRLIQLVLSKTAAENEHINIVKIDGINLTQGRRLRYIDNKLIDVIWTGTNIKRERLYLPVRMPLLGGLLGYRVALIHKDNREKFTNITQAQLKKLTACQGAHWPDSDILEDNGFKVERVVHYDSMFKMLVRKRCDYFPRAIYEAFAEQQALKNSMPEIITIDNFIIHYPFHFYYFVHRDNKQLAQRLQLGLMAALKDGSWLQLIKGHAITKHLFPLAKWHDKRFFELKNQKLPIQPKSLIFQLNQKP